MSTVEYAVTATRSASSLPVSTATLAEVDIRAELDARTSRLPDYEQENRAFSALTTEMATDPRNLFQKLVETAVDLCDAETAGISLLDGDVFRWEAVAGVFVGARGGTMPRSESPCGICIERNSTQLMHLADRCFPALFAEPRFVEALLIPFHDRGNPIGTVWIVSHTTERKFDKEDERIVRVLAQFASVGWQLWKTCEAVAASSRRKNDCLATLGHELRNPLATIMAAASILQQRVTGDRSGTRAVEVIAGQCQQVSRLTDDLLEVAHTESGKLTQLPESRDSSAGGLGLGFALVQSLADLHGGTVRIVSAGPGQGSHASRPHGDGRPSWLPAAEKPDAMSDVRVDPPSPKNRSLNNKLHRLLLVAPQQFAAVEGFVDEALDHALTPPPLCRLPIGAR